MQLEFREEDGVYVTITDTVFLQELIQSLEGLLHWKEKQWLLRKLCVKLSKDVSLMSCLKVIPKVLLMPLPLVISVDTSYGA
jgi:hypothetical protein